MEILDINIQVRIQFIDYVNYIYSLELHANLWDCKIDLFCL